YEGPSTDRVERPTPLGERALLQLAGIGGARPQTWHEDAVPVQVARPLDAYVQLVEALRRASAARSTSLPSPSTAARSSWYTPRSASPSSSRRRAVRT